MRHTWSSESQEAVRLRVAAAFRAILYGVGMILVYDGMLPRKDRPVFAIVALLLGVWLFLMLVRSCLRMLAGFPSDSGFAVLLVLGVGTIFFGLIVFDRFFSISPGALNLWAALAVLPSLLIGFLFIAEIVGVSRRGRRGQ